MQGAKKAILSGKNYLWKWMTQSYDRGVGTNLEVVRPGRGSGGAKPPRSQRFLKI